MRNSYLSVSGISVTHKSFVVSRNDILCHVERFVKEFKVRHVVTDVYFATFHISILFMIGRGIQYPSKHNTYVQFYSSKKKKKRINKQTKEETFSPGEIGRELIVDKDFLMERPGQPLPRQPDQFRLILRKSDA